LKNPEEYELEGLTMAEKREKVLKPRIILTVTPCKLPLIFTKRL